MTNRPIQSADATQSQTAGSTSVPGPQAAPPRVLEIPEAITVHGLASLIGVDSIDVIKQLMRNGYMYTINDVVDFETAATIAQAFGLQVKVPGEEERGPGSVVLSIDEEPPEDLEARPPVVTSISTSSRQGRQEILSNGRQKNG